MTQYFWPSKPKLVTSKIVDRATKLLEYKVDLKGQSLSDFLSAFKFLSDKEITNLYYGKIYRVKNITPNHLILQARRRRGAAYHYIDCIYNKDISKITFKIKSPTTSGYLYSFWPMILFLVFFVVADKTFTASLFLNIGLSLLYSFFFLAIGIYFLNSTLDIVKDDLEREMLKEIGLNALESN